LSGTDYSIGCDTALNKIVESADIIKQSAVSSNRRLFIMEVMGGKCGYLALMGAIAGGANIAYLPEEPLTLDKIQSDINYLKGRFNDNRPTCLILNNEKVSDTYTTDVLEKIFEEESEGVYNVRKLILGHLQQGNYPSVQDRTKAVIYARSAVNFLQQKCDEKDSWVGNVGIIDNVPTFNHILKLKDEMDFKNRRSINPWWQGLSEMMTYLLKKGDGKKSKGLKNQIFSSHQTLTNYMLKSRKPSYSEIGNNDMIPLTDSLEDLLKREEESNSKSTDSKSEVKETSV